MAEKPSNLILKYSLTGFVACLIGAFLSQQLGFSEGDLQDYMVTGIAGLVGGAVGGKIRKLKGKTR